MDSNLSLCRYLLTLFCSILFISFLSAAPEPYGIKEIFEACSFQGKESINSGNTNCTKLPIPNLWDDNANNRCISEYINGCNLAKIEKFCHLGSNDFLETNKCVPLNRSYEYGMEFYSLCCSVCEKGRETYLKRQSCIRSLPLDAEMPQIIVQAEFENCCSSKAAKVLRSQEDYEEVDPFDENYSICTKSGCDHFCVEIDYNKAECSCRNGFQLNKDGRKCDDINECLSQNECLPNQKCNNLQGSYECLNVVLNSTNSSLDETRKLNLRNKLNETHQIFNDTDSLQCKNGSYFDPHRNICIDMIDNYDKFCLDEKCDTNLQTFLDNNKKCNSGFTFNENGFCEDRDECAVNTCTSDQMCINRIGSFLCLNKTESFTCDPGLIKNGQKCEDVDECLDENKCKDKECINLIGDYKCVNKTDSNKFNSTDNSSLKSRDLVSRDAGPELTLECDIGQQINSKGDCVDIDICKENPGICGENATCSNYLGKYRCDCIDGFTKNEETQLCEDKNECETGENDCIEKISTCKNLVGSYECICKDGYEKFRNETSCSNIDECKSKELNGCDHDCLDTIGSYECKCREGYQLGSDNKTCTEIDQCNQKSKEFCDGICERKAEGDYTCKKCPHGFELDKEKQKCLSINQCKNAEYCPKNDSCIHLKNGKSECVNLNCPEDYEMSDEDKICTKKDKIYDNRSFIINKRVIILPSNMKANTKIYRFKKPEEKLDDVKLSIEITNQRDQYDIDRTYFELREQKLSYNLVLVKSIENEQNFLIEMNAIYRDKKLYTSELIVFVV